MCFDSLLQLLTFWGVLGKNSAFFLNFKGGGGNNFFLLLNQCKGCPKTFKTRYHTIQVEKKLGGGGGNNFFRWPQRLLFV